ncbi:uncharacterized protein LOC143884495 [Tasmannia lanceolata]|uniref:uncharacterized protein LOC143884495 n=1 Tax=Tasmannia lanceolata TaxID=3420 RepID=UPI004063B85F
MTSRPGKVRLVRCPKCRRVLTEFADIPMYKCGGCNAILRAKKYDAIGEISASETLEKTHVQRNGTEHNSEDNETITSRDRDKNSSDNRTNSNTVSLSGKLNYHGKEVPSGNGETIEESDENGGKGSDITSPDHVGQSFTTQRQSDHSFQSHIDKPYLDEQVEESKDHGRHGSDHIKSRDKMEETTESVISSVISEKDMADEMVGSKLDVLSKSPASSCANYGSVSSYDDDCDDQAPNRRLSLSKSIPIKPQSVVGSTDTKGSPPRETKMGTNSEVQSQIKKFSSMSLNEKYGPAITGSVSWTQDEPSEPGRYGFKAHEQGNLLDSEAFHSVRTWIESELGRSSSFESRDLQQQRGLPTVSQNGIPSNYQHEKVLRSLNSYASSKLEYLEHDRKELLRKVKELRDQLSRGKEKESFLIRSTHQESQWPSCYSRDPELAPSYVLRGKAEERFPIRGTQIETNHNLCYNRGLSNPPVAYRPKKIVPQQCGSSKMPFSGHATNCKHHVDWHCPTQLPPPIFYKNGPCSAWPRMCQHSGSSSPATPRQNMDVDSSFRRHLDHETEKFYYKEKRQPVKRHCRPIAGGSPFVICNRCRKLLQLPADFLSSRRACHKVRCGDCSKVLTFSFHDRTIACYTPTEIPHPPSEVDNSIDAGTENLASASLANGALQESRISYSDGGLSNLPSIPSDVMEQKKVLIHKLSEKKSKNSVSVPEPLITSSDVAKSEKPSLEENEGVPMVCVTLHKLMGYSSPSEIINSGSKD